MKINYKDLTYNISSVSDFSFDSAMLIWKTKYSTYEDFTKEISKDYPYLSDSPDFVNFLDLIKEEWGNYDKLNVADAFSVENIEQRRVIFNTIGVENIMRDIDPEVIDKQTITRSNTVFDYDGNSKVETLEDIYTLYKIEASKLFDVSKLPTWRRTNDIFVVKCKDASTEREYWIYVPNQAAENKDAIEAIAWTYSLKNEVYTEEIYRQGEVIISKHGNGKAPKVGWMPNYHMTKEEYLTKIKAQS